MYINDRCALELINDRPTDIISAAVIIPRFGFVYSTLYTGNKKLIDLSI